MNFNTATFIADMLGKGVDVDFGYDPKPGNIWIRILEDGVHTLTIHLFREQDGKIHLLVKDNFGEDRTKYFPGGRKVLDEVILTRDE